MTPIRILSCVACADSWRPPGDEAAGAGISFAVKSIAIRTLTLAATLILAGPVNAYEHEDSPVNFVEYAEGVLEQHKDKKRPYFLLFSAQWCYWCKVFAERSLTRK